ncbi:hypothetical protein CGGC5_v017083 [Colletotrichum fructicola Nara gc5]|uniref:Uncharacterized protein n=1 Tax=Colletotrichum fructicola (strain Nara gc5) TaxID=1213859 RepID=A0A7J6IDU6_COLFN|nr:hypothetical protein CGGC5_v017083 [Colletotrichum fructicola Nara gc5]
MNAETPYLCVLVFNLGCWMLLTRVFPLIRWVEATFVIDRQLIKDANDTGLRFLSVHLDEALSKDDRSLNGFNPPRTLRFTVGLVVLIENLVIMLLPLAGDQTSLASVARQAGRLCFLNILPLCLLAIPETSVMSHLMRQCREQWFWAHVFFGWLVAFQAAIHAIGIMCLTSTLSNVRWRTWATGLTSGILLVLLVIFSAWRQHLQIAISKVFLGAGSVEKSTDLSRSIVAHWVLGTVLAGVMIAHAVFNLTWALVSTIASSVGLLVGVCITRKASLSSAVSHYAVENSTKPGGPREPQVHVLEVGINTGSGTTTGEWYYFKVDNVPIRVARLERRERRDGAGYDLIAVLLMSRDAGATADPDVRGPYLIPLAAPVATNRPLRVIALDSGVVEAQQYLAWRCELKRVEAACTSLVWLNENPVFLKTWITNAGFEKKSQIRISNVIALSKSESIQEVLREEMPFTDDTYFIGEHFRSYDMSLIPFDEERKAEAKIVAGIQTIAKVHHGRRMLE